MREFIDDFNKGLLQGLRAYPSAESGKELLVTCFNLLPSEVGLIGHTAILPIGFTAVYFDYIILLDQDDVPWYWYVGLDGALEVSLVVPSVDGLDAVDVSVGSIHWVTIVDDDGVTWYVYPNITTGQPVVAATPPPTGHGGEIPDLRSIDSTMWNYSVDTITSELIPERQ